MQKRRTRIGIVARVTLMISIAVGCGGSDTTDGAPPMTVSVTGNVFVFPFGKNLAEARG
jgi:hypothetical protein